MSYKERMCFACLKIRDLTEEHIIPQSIGGRLTAYLYCEQCNREFGRILDSSISDTFGHIGTSLNIKRERGQNQPFLVRAIKKGIDLIFDGKRFVRRDPIVRYEIKPDGRTLKWVDVTARSKAELERIMKSLKEKYIISGEEKTGAEHHPGPTDVVHEHDFDNKLVRRAVSKIAYSFLCLKLPVEITLSESFEKIRAYINSDSSYDFAHANFVNTEFMTDYTRPLHKIHVVLNRQENLVAGYVMIFGIFRYTILLSNNYSSHLEWPCLDYTFDPVTLKEVTGNPNFRAPNIKENEILQPKQSKRQVNDEISRGFKILENYIEGYKFLKGDLERKQGEEKKNREQ